MAQPTKAAQAAARNKLTGPFHDPAAYRSAQVREEQLRDIISELTNPAKPTGLPSSHPFDPKALTRTEVVGGKRVPSMFYNQESERRIAQALSSARHERAIVEAALAMFAPSKNVPLTPAISGPFRASSAIPKAGIAGPIGVLVELLTATPDLNSNEAEELAKVRGPAYSNRETYDNLLQQALQQNSPLGLP